MTLSFSFGYYFWVPFFVSILLYTWFNTSAFVEYCRLFRLGKVFMVDRFDRSSCLDYPSFLAKEKKCFFLSLLNCPFCFGAWLNAGFLLINDYHLILFVVNFWVTMFFYFILNKLSK